MSIKLVQYKEVRNKDVIIVLDEDVEDTGGSWLGYGFLITPAFVPFDFGSKHAFCQC